MTNAIAINQESLRKALDTLRERGKRFALTTEIIHEYMGGVHRNQQVPPAISWNAQFGKYLKVHQGDLRIAFQGADRPVEVDGAMTSAALWSLQPDEN